MNKAIQKAEITGEFNWRISSIVPSFVSGKDARAIYEQVKDFGEVWYNEKSQTMMGSNFPIAAKIDSILRHKGIRVANLADLSKPEIRDMVKDRHYSDTTTLVLRTLEDNYSPNKDIIKELVQHIEQKQGKLRLPVLVSGLDVTVSDNKYKWNVVPRDDFEVVYDERLLVKFNGREFSQVDGLGLPLFNKKGDKTWYVKNSGISRLLLYKSFSFISGSEDLDGSGKDGRILLVRD
ncbi:MAG: hypothetical protein AABX83_04150 [Nanoarchaeota archaeon]